LKGEKNVIQQDHDRRLPGSGSGIALHAARDSRLQLFCRHDREAQKRRGETEEHTIWFNVAAWGRQAELAAEYLAKGRQVYVEGRLRLEEYTDREGNPRTSAEVNASDIHFLGQSGEAVNEVSDKADQNNPADEEAEIVKSPKPTSSRSDKKLGSKRASPKGDAGGEELGIVEDGIPF
jgi:single stranded DNA-binding protein